MYVLKGVLENASIHVGSRGGTLLSLQTEIERNKLSKLGTVELLTYCDLNLNKAEPCMNSEFFDNKTNLYPSTLGRRATNDQENPLP